MKIKPKKKKKRFRVFPIICRENVVDIKSKAKGILFLFFRRNKGPARGSPPLKTTSFHSLALFGRANRIS
jgi:hypothetical protein